MIIMFKEVGFFLKLVLKLLMLLYFLGYGNFDGLLYEFWRNNNFFWGFCMEFEIQDMIDYIK